MIFTTKIKRSLFFATVSVRKQMGVGYDDYLGSLSQGTLVSGEVVFVENEKNDIWMQLSSVNSLPSKYSGYWIPLSYNGKVFVDPLPVNPNLPPEPVRFARLRHCIQSPITGYKRYMTWRGFNGKGDPSVFKTISTKETKVVFLNRQLQEWIFGQIVLSANGKMTLDEMKVSWKNLTAWNKAFNNKRGREQGYADYILHENENAKNGLGCENVIGTGATVKLIGKEYKIYGKWAQDIEVADVLDPATLDMNWKTHWWIFFATPNSLNVGATGERIDPFPKMYNDWDTYWPLMGLGTNKQTIERDWLEVLEFEVTKPIYPYLPWRARGGDVDDRWDTRFVK